MLNSSTSLIWIVSLVLMLVPKRDTHCLPALEYIQFQCTVGLQIHHCLVSSWIECKNSGAVISRGGQGKIEHGLKSCTVSYYGNNGTIQTVLKKTERTFIKITYYTSIAYGIFWKNLTKELKFRKISREYYPVASVQFEYLIICIILMLYAALVTCY